MSDVIPRSFLNMLPVPVLLAKRVTAGYNFPNVFINERFTRLIGWDLKEIPDSEHWWRCAYPDEKYRKVIARQWELTLETAIESGQNCAIMDANVETKHRGVQRFRASCQLSDQIISDHFVLVFEPLE